MSPLPAAPLPAMTAAVRRLPLFSAEGLSPSAPAPAAMTIASPHTTALPTPTGGIAPTVTGEAAEELSSLALFEALSAVTATVVQQQLLLFISATPTAVTLRLPEWSAGEFVGTLHLHCSAAGRHPNDTSTSEATRRICRTARRRRKIRKL